MLILKIKTLMVNFFKNIIICFFPNEHTEFIYLGNIDYLFKKNTEEYNIVKDFILIVDEAARPKWCPKWFLRLLELYKNDNLTINKLHNKITKDIRITNMSTIYHSYDIIIYGYFNPEIKYCLENLKEKLLYETDTQI
jgi:hypothetical protein